MDPLEASQRLGDTPEPGREDSQTLRAERWRSRRLEKARHLQPERNSGFETVLLRLEKGDFLQVNFWNFHPKLTTISPGSGFSPGVRYLLPTRPGSKVDFQASAAFSVRGYQHYDLQFGKVLQVGAQPFLQSSGELGFRELGEDSPEAERFFLFADLRYRDYPQEDFFGPGPASLETDRSDYRLQDAAFDVVSGYRLNSWLSGILRAGFLNTQIGRGTDSRFVDTQDRFDDSQAPGLAARPDFLRINFALFADVRDNPGNPHRGGAAGVSLSRYQQRGGNEFDFSRLEVDLRGYLPLGSRQRVLALNLFGSADDADRGARVPFFLQNTLGGKNALRGFREFRFRDVNQIYFSAEYRWEAAPAVELALFGDFGKVFPRNQSWNLDDLEKTYGGGIRFKTGSSVLFRIEVTRGPEGTRAAFAFGPSF